ncbi:MAG: DUF3579 domain-containing protein [Pseudomonadota bacterium]|nr:DUF3579 domain-containing protein [Pseudomonadota bacterium]
MSEQSVGEVVIRGVTSQGRTFRPSDWADRLASILSHVGEDNRLNYSTQVCPVTRAGIRCVVINKDLEQKDSRVYKFLMDFAGENDLEVIPGRLAARA